MKSIMILLGICVLVAGCMSQGQAGDAPADQNAAAAGQAQPGGQGRQQRAMPQEALDACNGKQLNETCQFTANGRTVDGTCGQRRNGPMACLAPNMMTPQQAIDACGGKTAGDACVFTAFNRTMNGNCTVNGQGQIMCRPPNMGGGRGFGNGTLGRGQGNGTGGRWQGQRPQDT
jgi:hypothetical protein